MQARAILRVAKLSAFHSGHCGPLDDTGCSVHLSPKSRLVYRWIGHDTVTLDPTWNVSLSWPWHKCNTAWPGSTLLPWRTRTRPRSAGAAAQREQTDRPVEAGRSGDTLKAFARHTPDAPAVPASADDSRGCSMPTTSRVGAKPTPGRTGLAVDSAAGPIRRSTNVRRVPVRTPGRACAGRLSCDLCCAECSPGRKGSETPSLPIRIEGV